jgi:hypothetical protein
MKGFNRDGEEGSVILAILLICLIIVVAMSAFSRRIQYYSRENISHIGKQKAFDAADSGVYFALYWLRSAGNLSILTSGHWLRPGDAGAPAELSHVSTVDRYDVSLHRNLIDTSLVDAYATGYYYVPRGPYKDPDGRSAQRSVIHAKIRTLYIGDFFAAVPEVLNVGCGSNIREGTIYGSTINFAACAPGQTQVGAAYYLNGYQPMPANFVTFLSTPPLPSQLPSAPNLVVAHERLRASYITMAGTDNLASSVTLSGTWPASPPANGHNVFFSNGNLELGTSSTPLQFKGKTVIYTLGPVKIHNNVVPLGGDRVNNWLAIISEGDIHIADDAPDVMSINGLYVTGGHFSSDGNSRTQGQLTFMGGFVAEQGVDFAGIYTQSRTYQYVKPDPAMALPYITYFESYSETFNLGQKEQFVR